MEIKTIWEKVQDVEKFDKRVNEALAEGWKLAKRDLIVKPTYHEEVFIYSVLYAELVKVPQEKAPITWEEAVRVLKATCAGADDCEEYGCPIYLWCQQNLDTAPPSEWPDPEPSTE